MSIAASNYLHVSQVEQRSQKRDKKILLIDSDQSVSDRLHSIIKSSKHKSMGSVVDFIKAEKIIEQDPPDLILINVELDGQFSGYQTAKILKLDSDIPFYLVCKSKDLAAINLVDELHPNGLIVLSNSDYDIKKQLNQGFF